MKKMRNIGAILLAIVMLLSMSVNALRVSAAGEGFDPAKEGSIKIHKFENPESLPGLPNDGTEIKENDLMNSGLAPISEVPFTITQVVFDNNGNLWDPHTENTYSKVLGTERNGVTDGAGELYFGSLPQGIYYVEEGANSTTLGMEGFFVQIPMTNPNGDGYIYDVHVYPKNERSDFTKELISPELGSSTVTWKISSSVPFDIANGKDFVITDDLDYRLEYIMDSIVVEGERIAGGIKTIDSNWYSVDYSTPGEPDGILSIKFHPGCFTNLAEYSDLYITFDTLIVMGQNDMEANWDSILNTGHLEFVNKHNDHFSKNTNEVDVDPYGVRIKKVDNFDNNLAGAKFNIYATPEEAKEAITSGSTNGALANPVTGDPVWEVTTDMDGHAYFYGLQAGDYWIVERVAPRGFNLLHEPLEITVNEETTLNNVFEIKVKNSKGFTLPITGGAGTILFTLVGLLLIGTAIVTYTVSKKRKAHQA